MTPVASDRMMWVALTQIVLVVAWIGAAVVVAGVVAPAAFAVLPTRALAGALVGRVLPVLFIAGLVVGIGAAGLETAGDAARWKAGRLGAAIVLVLSCAVAHFVVSPRIARLREAIGPSLDALAADDVRRLEFGRLHGISVGLLGLGILAAVLVAGLAIAAVRSRG
jgi:hypothetical protein